MNITSNKTYEVGEKVVCILKANSYLEIGEEYTIESVENYYGKTTLKLKEVQGYRFNPARFISTREFRESQLNKILDNE
jgi:hypothetical protein